MARYRRATMAMAMAMRYSSHRLLSSITTVMSNPKPSTTQTLTLVQSRNQQSDEIRFDSTTTTDSFVVEKILFYLQRRNLDSLHNNFSSCLNPSIVVDVLYKCCGELQLGLNFVDFLSKVANFKQHSSSSLSAMIHMLVRGKRIQDAQVLILRMVRKSGVSRVEIVDSLVSTYQKCGSNRLVFDLLIRTYVQARKLREGSEAFHVLRSRGFVPSINACNSLLGGLVKVDWIDMAWGIYGEVIGSGTQVNV